MSRYTNPQGYTKYDSEKELCKELEKHFFPTFFDKTWKPIIGKTKEKPIRLDTNRSIIDYYGTKNNIPTYVEIKNDRIRQKYLMQIVRYYCECNEENPVFNLYIICTKKIRPHRENILKKLDIKILDITDIKPEKVIDWM